MSVGLLLLLVELDDPPLVWGCRGCYLIPPPCVHCIPRFVPMGGWCGLGLGIGLFLPVLFLWGGSGTTM